MVQFLDNQTWEPLQWSPCSRFIAIIDCLEEEYGSYSRLFVLNAELETEFAFPRKDNGAKLRLGPRRYIVPAWTPSCTLQVAVCSIGRSSRRRNLKACWRPDGQDVSTSAEAALAVALLAVLEPGGHLTQLAWSAQGGLAAVTQATGEVAPSCMSTLYIQLPGAVLASTRLERHVSMVWSPAGDCVLAHSQGCMDLLTSTCSLVVNVEKEVEGEGVFSPDGRHVAVVCGVGLQADVLALYLFRTSDGVPVLWQYRLGKLSGRLAFSAWGDKLVFTGLKGMFVVSFGQGLRPDGSSIGQYRGGASDIDSGECFSDSEECSSEGEEASQEAEDEDM